MHMRAVLFINWITLSAEAAKDCYWADGQSLETTNTTDYVPCYPNADVSHCCLTGEACLANGLCFGANYGNVGLVLVSSTHHILLRCLSTLTALPRCLHRSFLACKFSMRRSCILLRAFTLGQPIPMP